MASEKVEEDDFVLPPPPIGASQVAVMEMVDSDEGKHFVRLECFNRLAVALAVSLMSSDDVGYPEDDDDDAEPPVGSMSVQVDIICGIEPNTAHPGDYVVSAMPVMSSTNQGLAERVKKIISMVERYEEERVN